jgi:hypothetical protein
MGCLLIAAGGITGAPEGDYQHGYLAGVRIAPMYDRVVRL